jgi:hypothetical protein
MQALLDIILTSPITLIGILLGLALILALTIRLVRKRRANARRAVRWGIYKPASAQPTLLHRDVINDTLNQDTQVPRPARSLSSDTLPTFRATAQNTMIHRNSDPDWKSLEDTQPLKRRAVDESTQPMRRPPIKEDLPKTKPTRTAKPTPDVDFSTYQAFVDSNLLDILESGRFTRPTEPPEDLPV